MAFELPALPYDKAALEPHISARTLEFHHGKHHNTYVTNLNNLTKDTEYATMAVDKIIRATVGEANKAGIFNNAAQVWNHTFFWNSMTPNGGGDIPAGALKDRIVKDFGSTDKFKEEFKNAAVTQFGSGWAWLVVDGGKLKVVKTGNADTPLAHGQAPLLTIDVWEHAYYLDYQNRRADFVQIFLDKLVNWKFVADNLVASNA